MSQRDTYIEEKFALYASPTADRFYDAHQNIKRQAKSNRVVLNIAFVLIFILMMFFVSCALKADSQDWFRIGISSILIVCVFSFSNFTMAIKDVNTRI